MSFFRYPKRITAFTGTLNASEKLLLLGCRWRTTGFSGMHYQSCISPELGFSQEQFDRLKKLGLLHRAKSGYHRLLPLGYMTLEKAGVDWPADTSFPKKWEEMTEAVRPAR